MTTLDVNKPFLSQSFAYRRFKEQHTLCSEFYWHNILTRTMACKFSRNICETDNPNLLSPPSTHFPNTFEQWKKEISDVENWLRLNILLVSNSYFEQYFFEIAYILLSNRPALLLGDTQTINGVYYLKNNIYPQSIRIFCDNITKGSWNKRRKLLKGLISSDCFSDKDIECLDKIRNMRNKVAHRFGHDFVLDLNRFFDPHPQDRLSEKRLIKYLEFIENMAKTIDQALYPFVGNFELLLLWHLHKKENDNHFITRKKKMTNLINSYNVDSFISSQQAEKLLHYYDSF